MLGLGMSKTLDDKQQFIELRAKGYSFHKIADQLHVSKPTLISWSKEQKICLDVYNFRAIYMEELLEKHALTKIHRITVFGDVLKQLEEELDKRDMSQLPTDKLLSMVIKLSDTIRQDESGLELHGENELPVLQLGDTTKWKI